MGRAKRSKRSSGLRFEAGKCAASAASPAAESLVAGFAIQGLGHGAFSYLVKPTASEELERTFDRVLEYARSRNRSLLVVEDNEVERQSIVDLLGHNGVEITTAGTGAEYGVRDDAIREDEPLAPRTDYAVAKAAATLLCQAEGYRGRPVTTDYAPNRAAAAAARRLRR